MARRAARTGVEWETPTGNDFRWEHVAIEVLQDIRDELKQLNKTLSCYRVARMSDDINRLERRIARRLPLRTRRRKT